MHISGKLHTKHETNMKNSLKGTQFCFRYCDITLIWYGRVWAPERLAWRDAADIRVVRVARLGAPERCIGALTAVRPCRLCDCARLPPMLSVSEARTNLVQYAPISRPYIISFMAHCVPIYIYSCNLQSFEEVAQKYISANDIMLYNNFNHFHLQYRFGIVVL